MCHPLGKLLGSELSSLSCDIKLETSQLDNSTDSFIGLLFVSDEALVSIEGSGTRLIELLKCLTDLHAELKLRGGDCKVSFEVVLVPLLFRNPANCPEETSFTSNNKARTSSIQHFLSQNDSPPLLFISDENHAKITEYLARKYEIQESLSLVLLNASDGEVISYNAVENVLNDPKGKNFPWKETHFLELINSASLFRKVNLKEECLEPCNKDNVCLDTERIRYASVNAPVKALLFAAFWCPPCRSFLATLTEFYERINKNKKKFEIVFVSSDRSQESFNKFFSLMPWLAVPFEEKSMRESLTKRFNVKAIPNLTLLDENNEIITTDGRCEVNEDLEGIDFPWFPRIIDELRDRHSSILNHSRCLLYFTDDTDADFEKAELVLAPIAMEIKKSKIPEACEVKCFVAADSDLAESLRVSMDLDETHTYLVIMDISNSRYSVQEVTSKHQLSIASIKDFLNKFETNNLVYKHIHSRFV